MAFGIAHLMRMRERMPKTYCPNSMYTSDPKVWWRRRSVT